MSEDRDEATGQFTQSTEGLFGREHELVEAGYKIMPETPTPADMEREAADEQAVEDAIVEWEAREVPPEPIVYYDKSSGEPLNANISEGPVEAITVERAAADLAAYHDEQADNGAKSISADFAEAVDRARADAVKGDPKLAEQYGIDDVKNGETPRADKS